MEHPLQIKYCTTQDTELFAEIMKLRFEAYSANNRLTWQRTWVDMREEHDERSVIIVASQENQLCGSIRITVNNTTDKLCHPVSMTDYPPAHYLEGSRLCIAPSYRGKGLWLVLAAHMLVLANKTGRNHIIGCASDDLIPIWSRVGFKKTGQQYFTTEIIGAIQEILVLDLAEVLKGNCDENFFQILQTAKNVKIDVTKNVSAILNRA